MNVLRLHYNTKARVISFEKISKKIYGTQSDAQRYYKKNNSKFLYENDRIRNVIMSARSQ